ncbi:tkl protein kinase [Gigaspora margarita]|uniref:Tkl protein kinase n=1 Tax=Gigaspora margarita TaxID=4874 RepID=A0A8H3XAB3_GIGMA|nr:tkl protein kinase [Gigaspora margarita]
MEYVYNEASDSPYNSESDSFTSELAIHEQDAISNKIAKLKKKISDLEDASTMKEVRLNKGKRGPLNRNKVNMVEDESSDNETSKVMLNKGKRGPLNRNKVNMVEDESPDNETSKVTMNKGKRGPLNRNKVNMVEDESPDNETSKVTMNKGKRGPLNRNKVHLVEDESSNNETSKVTLNKGKRGPLNRNKVNMVEDKSSDNETSKVMMNKGKKGPLNPGIQKEKHKLSKNSFFSSYSKKNLESMRLLVAERLYHLCSTTEYRDMPLIEINKCIDKVNLLLEIKLGHNNRNHSRSTLNLNEMPEHQDTTTSINDRIKARKPNGNSKRAKKEKQVDHNILSETTDVDESELSLPKKNIEPLSASRSWNLSETPETQDTIQTHKPNGKNKRAKKGKQIGRNVLNEIINADESDLSLLEKNIEPLSASRSSNLSEMPETQDTIQTCKPNGNNKRAKKGNHIDHNETDKNIEPLSASGSSNLNEIPEIQDISAPTTARKPNGNSKRAKKGNHVDHNETDKNIEPLSASGSSKPNEIPEIQDITAPTTARKPNGNSKRAKKGNHVDHNVSNETTESKLNLPESIMAKNQDIVHEPKTYTLLHYIPDTVLPNLNWNTRYRFSTLTHLRRNTYGTFILLYKLTENIGTSPAYLRRSGRKRKVIK